MQERLALQAELEVAVLADNLSKANELWDRLFDVVTAIRSREGAARRKELPVAAEMGPVYEAARLASLQIKPWARGVQAA